LGARRAGLDVGEVEDLYAFQRLAHVGSLLTVAMCLKVCVSMAGTTSCARTPRRLSCAFWQIAACSQGNPVVAPEKSAILWESPQSERPCRGRPASWQPSRPRDHPPPKRGGTLAPSATWLLRYCLFFSRLCGLRLPMRPLSLPAAGSITALMRVGLPESMASFTARLSSSGVVTLAPTPPNASITLS